MANTTLQLRRGTQSENANFTGAIGELTVDTTRNTLIVHDGVTTGGSALATLASPALTGNPTAPTQTFGNNTTRLATTAFVQAAIAGFSAGPTSSDDVTEGTTNLYFTKDRVYGSLVAGGNITLTQNPTTKVTTISYTTPTNISTFTNDVGYLTTASIRTQVSATGSISYDQGTGVFSYTQAVDSVNSKTGAVVLNSDDISDVGRTNKWFSNTLARNALTQGTGITYTSGSGTIALANTSIVLGGKTISLTSGTNQAYTTDDLTEGSTNKYFSTTLARGAFSAGTGVTIVSGQVAIGQAIGTTATPTFAGLTVNGDVTIDSTTLKLDSTNNRVGIVTSNPQYELDVTGDINLTGKLRFNGSAGTANYVLKSNGAASAPAWTNLTDLLPTIVELDDFTISGRDYVFTPKNNSSTVTVYAPIQLLIIKNGSTLKPFINNSGPMWLSGISFGDYTLDSSGNIVFSSAPQYGDIISARVLPGNATSTINKTYPYRAIDIMTGY
jgi:hypothetical protein